MNLGGLERVTFGGPLESTKEVVLAGMHLLSVFHLLFDNIKSPN